MIVLCIGDVFGSAGRDALARTLPGLIRSHRVDFVVANGENLAHGAGITPSTAEALFAAGVDVITGGNHTWDRREGEELVRTHAAVLRPANYPSSVSGRGSGLYRARNGEPVGVINVQGRVFMPETDDPFQATDRAIAELSPRARVLIVDVHAEATSEKVALAWHLDGRVSILFGTHTHVATADARVLPKGTAYVTDVGMTGSHDSVIGVEKQAAIERFLTSLPRRLEPARGDPRLSALLVDIDSATGRARSVRLLQMQVQEQPGAECRLLLGEPVAERVRARVAGRARKLTRAGVTPTLALLSAGEDAASRVYLGRKRAAAEEAGISVRERHWEAGEDPAALERAIEELGRDPSVHGILLQLPLPAGWDADHLLASIPPHKDVDGFHPENTGRLALGLPGFVPCTPLGIRELLRHYQIETSGRRVVIVGRSSVVGRPLANLLSSKGEDATVTLAHSRTRELAAVTREAEILIVAMGKPRAITSEFVRPGAAVVDVGIHREPDPNRPGSTRLTGDVDAESVKQVAAALSPVPGGVGPLTVAFLLENTVLAAERATSATPPRPARRPRRAAAPGGEVVAAARQSKEAER